MKNRVLTGLSLLVVLSSGAWAADSGMDKILGYLGDVMAGGVFILIFALVASWLYLPVGIGFMALSYYKKKSEQSHEDSSLKAAGVAFLGALLGMVIAYVVVGTFGQYASGGSASDLSGGNKYMIKSIIQPVQNRLSDKLQGN